jgi:hypothetical protein
VGLTTLLCKKENCWEASKKFSRILRRRRPRPKLGCGAKERRRIFRLNLYILSNFCFAIVICTPISDYSIKKFYLCCIYSCLMILLQNLCLMAVGTAIVLHIFRYFPLHGSPNCLTHTIKSLNFQVSIFTCPMFQVTNHAYEGLQFSYRLVINYSLKSYGHFFSTKFHNFRFYGRNF